LVGRHLDRVGLIRRQLLDDEIRRVAEIVEPDEAVRLLIVDADRAVIGHTEVLHLDAADQRRVLWLVRLSFVLVALRPIVRRVIVGVLAALAPGVGLVRPVGRIVVTAAVVGVFDWV
jgi:hypothetical protein